MAINRRKLKFNVWRDPVPKPVDYLSPHCTNANCSWCKERARRKREAATRALEATLQPGMFWDRKTGTGQEHLGPPGLRSYVKSAEPGGPGDVLGFWPPKR